MSPPPNWSLKGRASRDLSIGQIRAPQSATEVHRHTTWQPVPVIGHPLSLRFSPRCRDRNPPPRAYGSCRSYGKRWRVSHSSLDGANSAPPTGSTGPATGCRRGQEGARASIAAAETTPAAGPWLALGRSDTCSAPRFEGKYPCKRLADGSAAKPETLAMPPRRTE